MAMPRRAGFLILAILILAGAGFGASETPSCADKSITAAAVRTPNDAEVFVQCAYELVQEKGFEEAYRAFHHDERWRSGPIYLGVTELTPESDRVRSFVFPPDPSIEGNPSHWGRLVDAFGNDLFAESYRVVTEFGEGWIYYSFWNPVTGHDEPKATYVKAIDWKGVPSSIGAGIYQRDLPGACRPEAVNAAGLAADPSNEKLQEFVRCAAMRLESMGYFASIPLSSDPRWRRDSIYVFGLTRNGNTLFSGDPYRWSGWTSGGSASELTSIPGRDSLSVSEAFGESFLYTRVRNPATGLQQRKVVFVKRVVSYGLPLLIGSGYYLDEWDQARNPAATSVAAGSLPAR